ncbi:Uncharacterised protein [Mannheimia haemolytica]|uniref:hypothetical protein n=1 Tax=Mannheimia haemolytica TaxID=75985 RepID=UPI000DA316BB|nr:hypothetical protein [Mannheimia haemolytica]SQE32051.1 Uncharacterised protein [Mannheimia haemolytica]
MKNLLLDLLGLTGFGLLCYGLYLKYGVEVTFITSGALLLLLAIFSSGGKR